MSDLTVFAVPSHWKLAAFAAFATLGIAVLYHRSRALDPWEQHLAAMERKLEAAWHQRHPGPPLPEACDFDEVHAGALELDPSPGAELVIANDRLGIAVLSEAGALLAFRDSAGCRTRDDHWWFNTVLSGRTDVAGIVMREETASGAQRCRTTTWATVLVRQGDTLVEHARYREHDTDQCAWIANGSPSISHSVSHARMTPRGVELEIERFTNGESKRIQCATSGHWITGGCGFLVEK